MNCKKLAALLLPLLLLTSCGQRQNADGLRLWFPADLDSPRHSAQAVTWETVPAAAAEVDSLVSSLLSGPVDDGMMNPFPPGTELLAWELNDGILTLDFSEPFGSLSGIDLTLACCCLSLTLCQIEQVNRVLPRVDGKPFTDQESLAISPEDVIFTGAEEEPRQINVALYFPRALGKGLGFEARELTLTENDDLYVMIGSALMNGPADPDLQTFLPGEDTLQGIWVDDGVCFVNFSGEFLSQAPEGSVEQNLLLYSVVDTFGNLDSVTAVQLLVDGERLPEFGGAETSMPLEPDFGMLRGG